jgi:hypothetical protein
MLTSQHWPHREHRSSVAVQLLSSGFFGLYLHLGINAAFFFQNCFKLLTWDIFDEVCVYWQQMLAVRGLTIPNSSSSSVFRVRALWPVSHQNQSETVHNIDSRYDHLIGAARRKTATYTGQHKLKKWLQASVPRVGFDPTVPVCERAKTFHALDRAATATYSLRSKFT